jgi:hypothetical protein
MMTLDEYVQQVLALCEAGIEAEQRGNRSRTIEVAVALVRLVESSVIDAPPMSKQTATQMALKDPSLRALIRDYLKLKELLDSEGHLRRDTVH